jgi:hypothetical protein
MSCCYGHRSGNSLQDDPCSLYKGEPIRHVFALPHNGAAIYATRDKLQPGANVAVYWARNRDRFFPVPTGGEVESLLCDMMGAPLFLYPGESIDVSQWQDGLWDQAGIRGAV